MKKPYLIDLSKPETLRVMNQTGVRQYVEPGPTLHNACWDGIYYDNGKVYLSLCSELTTGEYAKLAEYDPETHTLRDVFYAKDYILPGERFIRDSKFHTSLARMNDGRLVMLTHTTDKAPEHPAWLPASFYNHPFEGYAGSSLMVYDPRNGQVENWGIPIHRETIYGAAYDKINNVLYGIGYFNGRLYGIDLTDRSVRDFGQVTERASYRLIVGSDDNIYFTTRNGLLQRINVRERRVENLRVQLPFEKRVGSVYPYMSFGVNGPDGKLYMAGMHDTRLSRFDPADGTLEVLGDYTEAETYCGDVPCNTYMGSMGFDQYGVLYYVVSGIRKGGGEDFLPPSTLMRWDVLGGGKPEQLGLLGTAERTTYQCPVLLMDHQRDEMILIGTNHADDAPNLVAVDLSVYREQALKLGESATDPLIFPGNAEYAAYGEKMHETYTYIRQNTVSFKWAGETIPVQLWMDFSDTEVEDSNVVSLRWEGENLIALCGKEHFWNYTVSPQGEILKKEPCAAPETAEKPQAEGDLPCYPGRVYQATAKLAVPLSGGRRLIATEAGLLAIEKEGNYFSLGAGWPNGPVKDMTVNADGTLVYGVAGDRDDLNVLFSYDDKRGLRWLGQILTGSAEYGYHGSPLLNAVSLKGDDSILAVGGGGRMGMVYLYIKE